VLTRTARRDPDRLAIVWQGRRETYGEYDAAVNRTAHALADRGVGRGDRVAILSRNNRAYVVLFFAMAKLGAVSVPLNFMLNAEEVAFILGHSGSRGIVVEDGLEPVATKALELAGISGPTGVRGWIPTAGTPAPPGWEDVDVWEAHPDASDPDVPVGDDDPLQLMYTSGTESRPKGVTLTSRALVWQYAACAIEGDMTRHDVEVHALPFYHCAQLHVFFAPDVMLGATNVIVPSPDPGLLLEVMEAERATKLFCPPTVWISLLRHPDLERRDLSSLRKGYYGAAPMPVAVLEELGRRLPDLRLWNFYGQTEMAPLATVLHPDEQVSKAGSAGRASVNVETKVVDDDDRPVPAGEVGEIVHRSPHVMAGYWDDEAKTSDAFRNGWFHSGDLGRFDDDGYLWIVDRKKDMIKTGGENVASREVEEVLFQHPAVAEVAVFGVPHDYWIEAVVAVVVPRDPAAPPTPEEIVAFARARLAGYKVPKAVAVVAALPKNPSGKVLKRQLRDDLASLAASVGDDPTR
jgi:fatty-acyl-CoA synthase